MNVQFLMDGVKNDKEEEKIFDIKVQSNPVFEKEEIKSHIPHLPCNDDYIEIKVGKQDRTVKKTFSLMKKYISYCAYKFRQNKKNN